MLTVEDLKRFGFTKVVKTSDFILLDDVKTNAKTLKITDARPIRYRENIKTYRCAANMSGTINDRLMPKTEIHYTLHIADNDKDFIVSFE